MNILLYHHGGINNMDDYTYLHINNFQQPTITILNNKKILAGSHITGCINKYDFSYTKGPI